MGTLSAVIYFFFNLVTHSGQGAPYSTRPCMTPGSQKSHGDVWRPARPVKRDSAAFLACPSCPMTTADDSDKEAHQFEAWATNFQPVADVSTRPQTPSA